MVSVFFGERYLHKDVKGGTSIKVGVASRLSRMLCSFVFSIRKKNTRKDHKEYVIMICYVKCIGGKTSLIYLIWFNECAVICG